MRFLLSAALTALVAAGVATAPAVLAPASAQGAPDVLPPEALPPSVDDLDTPTTELEAPTGPAPAITGDKDGTGELDALFADLAGVIQLERLALRGPRPAPGIAPLRAMLDEVGIEKSAKAMTLLSDLEAAITPLLAAGNQPASTLLAALIGCAEQLTKESDTPLLWTGDAGEGLSRTLAHMMTALDALGS